MNMVWRKIICKLHPEGIPSLGSKLYNLLSASNIFQEHYNLVAHDIIKYCQEGKLLDIGTGPGWLLLSIHNILPQIKLSGIDISSPMIEKAKENIKNKLNNKDIELLVGSASKIPYPDNSMDCIVTTGSIHHWKDIKQGLIEIYRVLKYHHYALIYDLVQELPENISESNINEFGKFKMILLWIRMMACRRRTGGPVSVCQAGILPARCRTASGSHSRPGPGQREGSFTKFNFLQYYF